VQSFPRTWAEISFDALRWNLRQIRSKLPPRTLLALVVKADAYGHGLIPISRAALSFGADWIAVATVQEGIALREAGIEAPILVLAPALPMEAQQVVFYDLSSLIESLRTAEAISRAASQQGRIAKIHLKIDTGMARFGVQPEEASKFAEVIVGLPNVRLEGIASHFANAAFSKDYTRWQHERFQRALCEIRERNIYPEIIHIGNSAALVNFPEALNYNMVRIGILAYGITHVGNPGFEIRPVLRWKARIMAMREVNAGSYIGYNCTYRTSERARIATLGVGYGDGYHRGLSNKGFVMLHGKPCPIRGLVCMDQIMVETTHVPEADIGDEAILLGPELSAVELAKIVGTTPHEIPTRIMSRVPRYYIS